MNLVKEVERQQEAGIEERKIEKRGKGKKEEIKREVVVQLVTSRHKQTKPSSG